jgi:LysR family transcriptional activator of nhaA
LLPGESTALRRSLEKWFRSIAIRPQVVADFDDGALMKVIAAEGRGFVAIPSVIVQEAKTRYGLVSIGTTLRCVDNVYAITAERRLTHPAVNVVTESARRLFGQ